MSSKTRRRPRRWTARAQPAGIPSIVVLIALGAVALVGLYSAVGERLRPRTVLRGADVEIEGRPRLEIRNGCGEKGLAQEAKRRLIDIGFDVVHTGNADDFRYIRSIFIDLKGDLPKARELATAIGCPEVIQQLEPGPLADFAIVLGADHEDLKWQN
ncbi:MAG: hypothetical protein CME06_02555 [Gemmatimonadetes bacterium]|nr:hypothetical protein [Gemmatimonadota bacterium]